MNLLGFLAILHHPGSKSPTEVPGAEGPRVAAPIKAAKGTDPSQRRGLAPLAVALHPLPSARGPVCPWPSVSPHLLGARPALGLTSALISGSPKNRAGN